MLTEPFLSTDPPFSEQSSGVRELSVDPSPVVFLTQVAGCFELSGWTQLGSSPSDATQTMTKSRFWFVTPPTEPTTITIITDMCDTWGSLGTYQNGDTWTYFVPYDPYRYAPASSPCSGPNTVIWFPVGTDNEETATNLASAMSGNGPFNVTFHDNPDNALEYAFEFTSKAPAFEFDDTIPGIGWGDGRVDGGYYTYRSQSLNGCQLTVKLQNNMTGCFRPGGYYWLQKPATLGSPQPWLMIKSSGNPFSEWQSVFWVPGHYYFHGNPFQFIIWTDATNDRFSSSILVSMLRMDFGHFLKATPILIVSSENLDMNADYQHLMQKLHWENSIGSGFNDKFYFTNWGNFSGSGPNPDGKIRTPMAMFRGLRNVPLLTLSETALAQPAYILLSEDPTGQPAGEQKDMIGGRLWDMAILTDTTLNLDAHTIMDGKHWQRVSESTRPTDLFGSLWVTHDPVTLPEEGSSSARI